MHGSALHRWLPPPHWPAWHSAQALLAQGSGRAPVRWLSLRPSRSPVIKGCGPWSTFKDMAPGLPASPSLVGTGAVLTWPCGTWNRGTR